MKSILLFAFAFLSANFILYAQNSKSGYIVTIENDTINGYINDQVNFRDQVFFKDDKKTKFKEYRTNEIQSFSIDGVKVYETITLTKDSGNTEKIFGLVLAKGQASLYLIPEKKNDAYFLKINDNVFKLTKNDSIGHFKETGELFHREDNRFRGILTYYLNNCAQIRENILNTRFSPSSLTKLINKYNNCVSPELQDLSYKKVNPIKLHFGPKFGYGLRTVDLAEDRPRYRNYKFDISHGNKFGIFANFTYKNKFSLQPEVLVNRKGATGKATFYSNTTITSELRVTYLQFPVNFIYYFNLKSFQPYILAGAVYGIPLKKNLEGSYIDFRGEQIRETLPIYNLDEIGYRFGVGVKQKLFGNKKLLLEIIGENTITDRNPGNRINFKGVTLQTGIEF